MWHDGEARILGLESVSLATVPPPGTTSSAASVARVPVPAASAAAAPGASTVRKYVIESSNFRLASVAEDGYDAWAVQVRILVAVCACFTGVGLGGWCGGVVHNNGVCWSVRVL